MIKNSISLGKILARSIKYSYITPVQKPVMSLALNAIAELSTQSIQFCHDEWGLMAQASVVVGAFGFRIGVQFLGLFFESLNMRRKDTWAHRWIDKVFLVDLRRDVDFYELSKQKQQQMTQNYTPERLFSTFLKGYTFLNFFRGCHHLITSPSFLQFCTTSLGSLTTFDPIFMLPLPIIFLNYLILAKSRHPFFIHLTRPQNKMMCFTIAFMGGLLFVPVASVYGYGYLGLALGHLAVRKGRYWMRDVKEDFGGVFSFKWKGK